MKVISTVADLQKSVNEQKMIPVGFVPTMGALHPGHLSLVRSALEDCPLVIVSIFVNPTQFNDLSDLKNYPRDIPSDLEMLSGILRENDIVFTPSVKEIYPGEDKRQFSFGNLDNVMEALHRPGHFNGVAQVVSRLFSIVKPDMAWFGLKDFQQVAVIKELVRQTGDKVKIISKPIVREKDGLAMSSRNSRLSPEIRKKASVIYRTLSAAAGMTADYDIPEIKSFVENTINKEKDFTVEYFEIADDTELLPVNSRSEMDSDKHYFGCIAVMAGNIRLIDNMELKMT